MQMAIKYLISNRYFAKKSLLFFSFIFENVLFFQNKLTALTSIFESDSRTWKNQVRVLLDKTNKNKEEENVKESNGIFFSSKIMLLFFLSSFCFQIWSYATKKAKSSTSNWITQEQMLDFSLGFALLQGYQKKMRHWRLVRDVVPYVTQIEMHKRLIGSSINQCVKLCSLSVSSTYTYNHNQ